MLHAIDNERIGIKNRLDQLHKHNAQQAIQTWEAQWQASVKQALIEIEGLNSAQQFQHATAKLGFAAAIIYDAKSTLQYPTIESPKPLTLRDTPALKKAKQLDFIEKDKLLARDAYIQASQESSNKTEALQLLTLAARCEYQAGRIAAAYKNYRSLRFMLTANGAANEQLNENLLIVIPTTLRALEIAADHPKLKTKKSALNDDLHWLADTLNNYTHIQLPSRKRSFFMSKANRIAQALNVAVDTPTLNPEIAALALLDNTNNTPTWLERPQQQALIRLKSASSHVLLYVTQETLTASLQRHLNAHLPPNTAIAYIHRLVQYHDQDLILQTATNGLISNAFITIRWASSAHYQKSFSKRQITYIAMVTSIISFLCFGAIFTFRHLRRKDRLSELKNDAISTIAHELKTPLTSIRLLLDNLIANPERIDKNTQEYVTIISQEHDRLSSLVDNFLTFSRFENNKLHLNEELLDANEMVKECCQLLRERIQQKAVTLTLNLAPQHLPIYGDKSLLLTTLINLIDNARKYSTPPKKITITTQQSRGQVYLAVMDNGIGLSRKDQKQVFDQYFRVEKNLSRTTEGSGLGLHIAQKIACAHTGKISVASQIGIGSTFTLSLPLTSTTSTSENNET